MVEINLKLPQWAEKELQSMPTHFLTLEERMAAVVDFSRKNYQNGTGGPFAAGVFEKESGRMVIIGVNRVVPLQCSSAHAEVMALSLAQKMLGSWDLGAPGMPTHQLVVNWRPCAMCYGAVIWSGVRSLVVAGSGPELEEITGFDEGPVPADWQGELEKREIELVDGVLTEQAIRVFQEFANSGALVYNSRQG